MIDPHAWRQRRAASLGTIRAIGAGINGFCARVNAGLVLVAVILALVVVATAAVRIPEIIDETLPPITVPDSTPAE
jgi:hypothetical protein